MKEDNKYVLEMQGINLSFFGVQILHDVELKVKRGEVHALLGENGAGKSSLMKILNGAYKADSGTIILDGEKVNITSPKVAKRHGISFMHQEILMVNTMTVAENIYLGEEVTQNKLSFLNKKQMLEKTQKLLDSLGLDLRAEQEVGGLSVAQQQMLEIARALAFDAKIIVMDEPTSSLTEKEVDVLFQQILKIKERGIAVIYISHRLKEIMTICDSYSVLRDGHYVGSDTVAGATNEDIVTMMVGRQIEQMYIEDRLYGEETVLEFRNVSNRYLHNVSFTLKKGEILGFAGLVGAGRTEMARALFGIDPIESGEILINGKVAKIRKPADAIKLGVGLVPEDRKKQGLILIHSVAYNLSLLVLNQFIKGIKVDRKKEAEIVDTYSHSLTIKMSGPEQRCVNLSGGNQQKVVISKWLAVGPQILILDEPTRGIDVGAKSDIYHLINRLAKSGMAVIVISSEMPEIINLSSRVVTMYEGGITGVLDTREEELTQEKLMWMISGGKQ